MAGLSIVSAGAIGSSGTRRSQGPSRFPARCPTTSSVRSSLAS